MDLQDLDVSGAKNRDTANIVKKAVPTDVFLAHAVLIMAHVNVRNDIMVQNVTVVNPVCMVKNVKMIVHWDVLRRIVVCMVNASVVWNLRADCAIDVSLDYMVICVKVFALQNV